MIIPFIVCETCRGTGKSKMLTEPSQELYCPDCRGRGDMLSSLTVQIRDSILKELSYYLDDIIGRTIWPGVWCFVCQSWVPLNGSEGSRESKGWCCQRHTTEEIRESNRMIPDGYCLDREGHLQELA